MATDTEIRTALRATDEMSPIIAKARAELDKLAEAEKLKPLVQQRVVVDVAPIKTAQDRITELERTLQSWQRVAARGGTITAGDLTQIDRAKSELKTLQAQMAALDAEKAKLAGAPLSVGTPATGAAGGLQSLLGGLNLGSLVGGFAISTVATRSFAEIKRFMADSVQEAMASEKAQKQLETVLRSTGGAAGVTAKQVNGLASQLQDLTGVEDDVIMSASNVMLTFTKVGAQVFPEAVQSALDMSVAMGTDLQSAIVQVGKALNDPITGATALRRVGVSLTDQQMEQIKVLVQHNDLLAAQKLILGELSTEFAGSAVAAGETYAGELDKLQRKIEGIKELVGKEIIVTVRPVIAQTVMPTLNTVEYFVKLSSSDAETRIEALNQSLARTQQHIKEAQAAGGWIISGQTIITVEQLQQALAGIQAELDYLRNLNAEWGDAGVAAATRAAQAAAQTRAAVGDVSEELGASQDYWNAWGSFAEQAAIRASNAAWAVRSAMGYSQTPYADTTPAARADAVAAARTEWARNQARIQGGGAFTVTTADEWFRAQDAANKAGAKSFQAAYDKAAQQVSSRIEGYMSGAQNALKGLLSGTKLGGNADITTPGANGPFENLYRAADVAKNGEKSPWAKILGLDQAGAQQIVNDFARGAITPAVEKLIDTAGLVNEAKLAAQAEQFKAAFVAKVAKQAGVGTSVIEALIGTQVQAGDKTSPADQAVARATAAVGDAFTTQVTSDAFKQLLTRNGSTTFGYFETGFVDAAKKSTALQAAIDAMAVNALLRAGANTGSAAGAARAQGVTP